MRISFGDESWLVDCFGVCDVSAAYPKRNPHIRKSYNVTLGIFAVLFSFQRHWNDTKRSGPPTIPKQLTLIPRLGDFSSEIFAPRKIPFAHFHRFSDWKGIFFRYFQIEVKPQKKGMHLQIGKGEEINSINSIGKGDAPFRLICPPFWSKASVVRRHVEAEVSSSTLEIQGKKNYFNKFPDSAVLPCCHKSHIKQVVSPMVQQWF